jgi:hypothetical protein
MPAACWQNPRMRKKMEIFWDTIPASSVAQINFMESSPRENLEISDTNTQKKGAFVKFSCLPAMTEPSLLALPLLGRAGLK